MQQLQQLSVTGAASRVGWEGLQKQYINSSTIYDDVMQQQLPICQHSNVKSSYCNKELIQAHHITAAVQHRMAAATLHACESLQGMQSAQHISITAI